MLDVSSVEWHDTMGQAKNSKEAAEWAEELKRRGYDMIDSGDEQMILNPEKFKTKAQLEANKQPGKFSKALQSQYKFTPKDLVKEPNIELKSDMVVRGPSGGKVALKAGETYTPFKIEGTKKVALRDGKDYVIQAGDYEKALQNSKRAIPQPIEISKKVEPNVLWDADVQSSKNGGKLENGVALS